MPKTESSSSTHHVPVQHEPSRGPIDVVRAEEDAYVRSLHDSAPEMTRYVVAAVGQRRTAAALGLRDARPLQAWVNGGPIKEEAVRSRLRVLYRVTHAVTSAYSREVAAAFLESTNPRLEDRSPLSVLASAQRIEDAEAAVIAAARTLLEG